MSNILNFLRNLCRTEVIIPNQITTNLSSIDKNDDEIAVLKLGLKHGLFIRPEGSDLK